ncbi:uncharacterized protein OCT59_016021 [Rhizophagus irregularis]|uniref:F-box domain-containing protein n=2 Tax=Rhizophagus irregularis TaxID=588596 RepID=A0A015IVM0_RHIIW|nr:hypothetical protein GLOIN_2v1881639 [Rhizophagus irregularis DAOM 181602=DAOM 197198]EXX61312.1 hypothetical protein RirG_172400 [Rhizophagus irregularis DAOM 197198w]PKY19627.1 hypothetical protein RhiirB3_523649 [Rhizophagus irregularis]POG64062.1 hypothetical protein GLOIN_2v1881639 [Rhizophagus irregularis DAOM 181602=DAOM 197198]UZO23690.1 hypothetical protein OCT59_016021 [Rhizophagus irregularis]GBC30903.1 hypothetical protein GLOIN_2v1881639 [Rhizophagus irregularis DAOM 181602=DAO|eukprot:XP_025170928.1 hypothetical protein GLOIN_2v1881639 [Rhizophagus irregularis DAOM 181602=DAOM 197198]
MSCSKIFSGNLPELIYEIIKNFQNDFSTLHSCVLVNRLWCRLAIPLLWENPFSITTGSYNFIEVYLYNLNDYLKTKINDYQIINYLLPSKTLFNYPSFIRYLNIYKVTPSIERWLEANDKTYLVHNVTLKSVSEFKRLINMSLIKLFIENEVNLHTFKIELNNKHYDDDIIFDGVFRIILQNPNFIHNSRNLSLSIVNNCENTLIKNRISQIINLHQNLQRILFSYNNLSLYQSLLLSKEFNCSNTLNTIIFYYVNFNGINNLVKVFENLYVLESVHIIHCSSLDRFIQQIINLTKPFKLKSLFISWGMQIDPLKLLLQKYGNYLENFKCGSYGIQQQLLELIMKYCRNIKFLDLYEITSLVFGLIENIKQNLNHLSINVVNYQEYSILRNLGQVLPSKLEYLSLALYMIKANDFEVFLKNSQDTFFKKLLINHLIRDHDRIDFIDILPHIKEYIMKKKRVKYLAIKNTSSAFDFREIDLSNLKDEVNEFKLYNIKVLKYVNLSTDIYRFINEID